MLDISELWLLFDVLAIILIMINVFLLVKRKNQFCLLLAFLSMVSECLALLGDYQQVLNKINTNDVGYILDVIPYLGAIRTPVIFIIIVANAVLIAINFFLKKNQ